MAFTALASPSGQTARPEYTTSAVVLEGLVVLDCVDEDFSRREGELVDKQVSHFGDVASAIDDVLEKELSLELTQSHCLVSRD